MVHTEDIRFQTKTNRTFDLHHGLLFIFNGFKCKGVFKSVYPAFELPNETRREQNNGSNKNTGDV